jgi:hypothetical protein
VPEGPGFDATSAHFDDLIQTTRFSFVGAAFPRWCFAPEPPPGVTPLETDVNSAQVWQTLALQWCHSGSNRIFSVSVIVTVIEVDKAKERLRSKIVRQRHIFSDQEIGKKAFLMKRQFTKAGQTSNLLLQCKKFVPDSQTAASGNSKLVGLGGL